VYKRQSIAVGWGGGVPALWQKATGQVNPGTIFTFAIGADTSRAYTGFAKTPPAQLVNIEFEATEDEVAHGKALYGQYCTRCHGHIGMNGGSIPNLAYSTETVFSHMKEIVLDGVYQGLGMPKFSDRLTEADLDQIRKYILDTVSSLPEHQQGG
jgi:quinohemoprotein ethanol dehydrogenase